MAKNEPITIEKARQILGKNASTLTDSQIQDLISSFEFLADGWLDEFEIKLFGKKLSEMNIVNSGHLE